jgi:penicillin-binding protein 2
MCSFGQGVSLTPLQLGAFVAAIANGGTLYYLQHPTSPWRSCRIPAQGQAHARYRPLVPDLQDGMAGAVEYGTARRLRANFQELPVFGKTGTCSDNGTRFGWFASFLSRHRAAWSRCSSSKAAGPPSGPRAAELTGEFYKNLWDRNYFADKGPAIDGCARLRRCCSVRGQYSSARSKFVDS